MKKLLTLFTFVFCSCLAAMAQFSGAGSGTSSDPYKIYDADELFQMSYFLNRTNVYFKLMQDIDLRNWLTENYPTQGWQPIGTLSTPFRGNLNGNGKRILNLSINRPNTEYVGLFGYTLNAKITDLTITGTIIGGNHTGSLVGHSGNEENTSVNFIAISGYSFEGTVSGNDNTGGISGESHTNATNCHIKGTVSGHNYVGGICGYSSAPKSLSNCYFEGSVSGNLYVGGISGLNYRGIDKCGFWGNVNGAYCVGGIAGMSNGQGSVPGLSSCSAVGNINCLGQCVGGIAGWGFNKVADCYFHGEILGGTRVGGIIGYCHTLYKGIYSRNYSKAIISGTDTIGGIVGLMHNINDTDSTFCSNVAMNTTISSKGNKVGRIYGTIGNSGHIGPTVGSTNANKALATTTVYINDNVQNITDSKQNGTTIGISLLRLKATFVSMGWNFSSIWNIQDTESFPYQQWQTAPPVFTSQPVSGTTTVNGKSVNGGTVTLNTTDSNSKYTASTNSNNLWTITLGEGLHSNETIEAYAKSSDLERSYTVYTTASVNGSGASSDPYLIYTAYDLANISGEGYYKLMNDIDLTSCINDKSPTTGWEPVGVLNVSDKFVFDGDGHVISGLWCKSNTDYAGLFSSIKGSNSIIKNLTLENVNIDSDAKYCGGLIGLFYGQIQNCTVTGSVKGRGEYAGLIAGATNSIISNSQTSGTVSGTATYMGGLCGVGSSTQCKTNSTVNGGQYVGGLIGVSNNTVSKSFSTGNAIGTTYVGGLIGLANASVSNCYSTDEVTTTYTSGETYSGGLIGVSKNSITNSFATGNVNSTKRAAGVVCLMDNSNASTNACVAINNSVSSFSTTGSAMRVIGSFSESVTDPELTCLAYDGMEVSINGVPKQLSNTPLNGTATSMTALNTQTTYTGIGWDFTNVWYMNSDTGFPDFIWNRNNEAHPLIKNYYEEAELSEWTISNNDKFQRNTWSTENDASGIQTPFIEAWKNSGSGYLSDGDISHNTIYLTPGSYTVNILARIYNEGNTTEYPSGISFYANDASVDLSEIGTKSSYTNVYGPSYLVYANISVDCTVGSDGKLDLGFMLENVVGNWFSFKNLLITPKEDGDDNKETQSIELTQIPAMTYGDGAYTLPSTTNEGLSLTWTSSNSSVATVSGNTLTIKGAGTATITATQAGNENYAALTKEYALTVNKASLTITADDKTKQEGTENPELTVSYSGFVYDDDASALTTLPTITTTATASSPAGTYPITVSGAAADNYDITYVNGTLTVTEEPVVEEDTDISRIDNVVYITPFEAYGGDEVTLSIKMKNNVGIQTVQFDMYLPEGVEVVEDEDGFELIELSTERTTAKKMNQFSVVQTSGGAYRVLINSTGGYTFDGNDGEIATAQIKLADDITPGDYPMIFRDIVLVTTSSEGFETDYVKFTLTVPDYMLGDVNSDRKVNAIDLNAITNYILEHRTFPFTFNTRAGDVNSDTKINAIDLNAVTNMILHQTSPAGIKLRAIEVGTFDE